VKNVKGPMGDRWVFSPVFPAWSEKPLLEGTAGVLFRFFSQDERFSRPETILPRPMNYSPGEMILLSTVSWSPYGNDFPVELSFQSGNEDFSLHAARAQSHPCGAGPGLANIEEIKRLRGDDLQVAAQANVQIDAEMAQKDPFR